MQPANAHEISETSGIHRFGIENVMAFCAVTRGGASAPNRVVRNITPAGRPVVHACGWSDFQVRPDEILSVVPKPGVIPERDETGEGSNP